MNRVEGPLSFPKNRVSSMVNLNCSFVQRIVFLLLVFMKKLYYPIAKIARIAADAAAFLHQLLQNIYWGFK
jgi:hypothetical protein